MGKITITIRNALKHEGKNKFNAAVNSLNDVGLEGLKLHGINEDAKILIPISWYEKLVLAHELGHALLHTETYTATFNKNLLNKGNLEKQAHYFALRLLKIEIEIDDIDFEVYTIEQILKALYVSEDSLKYFV